MLIDFLFGAAEGSILGVIIAHTFMAAVFLLDWILRQPIAAVLTACTFIAVVYSADWLLSHPRPCPLINTFIIPNIA